MGSAVSASVGSLVGITVGWNVNAMVGLPVAVDLFVGRTLGSFVEFIEGILEGNLVVDSDGLLSVGVTVGIFIGI